MTHRQRFGMVVFALAALPCLLGAAPQRPLAMPTRDVDVIYQSAQAPGATQRVRWDAAAGRERVDPPPGGFYVIVNFRTRRLLSVRDSIRTVVEFDAAATGLLSGVNLLPGAYDRLGGATIAGLACTVWRARGPLLAAAVCVTDDGVLLRVAAGDRVLAEASSVSYGPADPAAFAIPAGYRHIVPGQETTP